MERIPVSSSNIASIGYDSPSEILEIEFKNFAIYQYFNVPIVIYEALMSSSSHGTFLNAEIKPNYTVSKM